MDLTSVKLKKTEPRKPLDSRGPAFTICENDEQYSALMSETCLEVYLELLGDITFPTFVLSLESQSDLIRAHQQRDWHGIPSLEALAQRIDAGMQSRGWPLVFVRLSSRSPKDAALMRKDFKPVLAKHYNALPKGERNSKLLALYAASTECLGCKNGADALELLTLSERIQDDLKNMQNLNLCVRKFISFLPEFELRAFVWNKKLTGLTQYNQFVVSSRLQKNQDACLRACQVCFESIIAKLGATLSRFAIDFVVIEQEDHSFKAFVVEINPLAEFTGFGLFDWLTDWKVIQGASPFEFRIATEEPQVLDIDKHYAQFLADFDNL